MIGMQWGMIGHEWVTASLERAIAAGRGAQTYLLSGPEGVGKTLLATRLAQALNCEEQTGAPCLQCRTCLRIERGVHPDIRVASMEMQAAQLPSGQSKPRDLKINTVREWQRDITFKPYEARRRVFILHDADRLSEEASNAMLKTLEEPPLFVTLILVATTSALLPTIVSRCQEIRLRPLPREQVHAAVHALGVVDEQQTELIAAWSEGRIGWALQTATDPDAIEARHRELDELLALQTSPRHRLFQWAEERSKEFRGGEQERVIRGLLLWQGWWHDVLLMAATCPERVVHVDRRSQLEQEARCYSIEEISAFLSLLNRALQQLRENVNPQLVMEHLCLHVPSQRSQASQSSQPSQRC
jgi:DNA polymerase-3 subunit delta'